MNDTLDDFTPPADLAPGDIPLASEADPLAILGAQPPDVHPIADAIRNELRRLLDSERFGIAELTRIAKVADAGRGTLQALEGIVPRGRGNGFGVQLSPYEGGSIGLPITGTNNPETFGTTALREVRSMFKALGDRNKRTRMTIIRELALAKKEGLDDLAAELRQELDDRANVEARHAGEAPGLVKALNDAAAEAQEAP